MSIEKNKRSGRTTRMLAEATRLAKLGRAVYVVVSTEKEAGTFTTAETRRLGIKFEPLEFIHELDWRTMRIPRTHPNCVILVDHFVIEARFAAMIEMLHRFDQPEVQS